MPRGPVISLSHGGGPMPLMADARSANITKSLSHRVPKLLKLGTPDAPRAIVVVTAHWSAARGPRVTSGKRHELLFDYYGFPKETYEFKYDAPGEPGVARRVYEALRAEGLQPEMDEERGWDHGVFVPMLLINPPADIPIVQVSVLASEDPAEHIAMGRALATLRDDNIAIIGSGFASFHNLRLLFAGTTQTNAFQRRNGEWSKRVTAAATTASSKERAEEFTRWRTWPGAYEHHPERGAEHFLPLVVCAGAGGDVAAEYYTDEYGGLDMYSYYWT